MTRIAFELDLRDPARRRVTVHMAVSGLPDGCELGLAVWTPGSYLVREYSRHLGEVEVELGGSWEPCPKTSKNRYRPPAGATRIRYAVYAHELSVRTSDLTADHALLQGAATFLWPFGPEGAAAAEASLQLEVPDGWQVATSLAGDLAEGFVATGLDDLVDSPILAGAFDRLEFEALGKPHSYVLDGLGPIAPPDSLVPDTIRIIEEAAAVFGGTLPYERYDFFALFSDSGRGGLEHLSSTVLLAPRTSLNDGKGYRDFMGLVSHEFFHVWNVKRMRPAELWDLDYERENYTRLLWVAEGFTAYYDDLLCRRAGVFDVEQYLDLVANHITEMRRTPGRLFHSLSESSFDAWIRLYRPDENTRNSTLSYYGNGALAAMLIDLRIRKANPDRSLDGVLANLFASTFEANRGYTREDVQRAIDEAAGEDLSEFVTALVDRPFDPDFATPLADFGLELVEKTRSGPYLGVVFKSGSTTLASVRRGTPADLGGLAPGDELLAIQGLRITNANWSDVFAATATPDAPLNVLLNRRGEVREVVVKPAMPPAEKVGIRFDPDADDAARERRRAWLGE